MKKIAKTLYYTIEEKQPYKTTRYIEKFINEKHMNNATKRCYQYCKKTKEDLDMAITRVEAKYQSKYFSNDYKKMLNELNKHYLVLHIKDKETREWILEKLKKEEAINARTIKKLRLNRYRVMFDTDFLEQFLEKLYTYKDEDDVNNYEKEKLLSDVNKVIRAFNTSLLDDFNIQ